ncbi:MAG: 4a-hydroxytetrahydrobiopterin dehydratase [Actinomycetota bacterium]|nr:4a-hydroxytetrahydrobiopterin dehydratase [Actinomycetota bacterium]
MERLDEASVAAGIAGSCWHREGDWLVCTRSFAGFAEAVSFVDRVAVLAERHDHHPDITISYDRVTLRLTTHDAGGLTGADLDLASAIDTLADPPGDHPVDPIGDDAGRG